MKRRVRMHYNDEPCHTEDDNWHDHDVVHVDNDDVGYEVDSNKML